MSTKVTRFVYSRISNASFLTVFRNIEDRLTSLPIASAQAKAVKQQFANKVAQMDADYCQVKKSALTADIQALDRQRDEAADAALNILRAWEKAGNLTACQAVEIAKRYGFSSTMQMDTESTIIEQMQQEYAKLDLRSLGVADLWQTAVTTSATLQRTLNDRDDERVGKQVGVLKADRDLIAAAWQSLIEVVEAHLVIASTPELEAWTASLNAYLTRVRNQITKQSTSGSAAGEGVEIDVNPDAPEEGSGSQPSEGGTEGNGSASGDGDNSFDA